MDISEQLTCLFTAEIEERDESYLIEIPVLLKSSVVDRSSVLNTEDKFSTVASFLSRLSQRTIFSVGLHANQCGNSGHQLDTQNCVRKMRFFGHVLEL